METSSFTDSLLKSIKADASPSSGSSSPAESFGGGAFDAAPQPAPQPAAAPDPFGWMTGLFQGLVSPEEDQALQRELRATPPPAEEALPQPYFASREAAELSPEPAPAIQQGITATAPEIPGGVLSVGSVRDAQTGGLPQIEEGTPEGFFRTAAPYAKLVEQETGIPAALSLAIAANETGYGQRRYMAGANNYHGIQGAPDDPDSVPYVDWRPGENGEEISYAARQRQFTSPLDGFRAFARVLQQTPNYQQALARYKQTGDVNQLAADVHAAGYAEDPQYTTKIQRMMRSIPQEALAQKPTVEFVERLPGDQSNATPDPDYDIAFGFNEPYTNPFNPAIPNHRGVDLQVRGAADGGRGRPVGAFQGGVVAQITRDPNGGNGVILQDTETKLYYRYFHFGSISVDQGDVVKPGQTIGILGDSGTEGFPHVHFEVAKNPAGDPMGQLIDPRPFMQARPRGTAASPVEMSSGDEVNSGDFLQMLTTQVEQEDEQDPNAVWMDAQGAGRPKQDAQQPGPSIIQQASDAVGSGLAGLANLLSGRTQQASIEDQSRPEAQSVWMDAQGMGSGERVRPDRQRQAEPDPEPVAEPGLDFGTAAGNAWSRGVAQAANGVWEGVGVLGRRTGVDALARLGEERADGWTRWLRENPQVMRQRADGSQGFLPTGEELIEGIPSVLGTLTAVGLAAGAAVFGVPALGAAAAVTGGASLAVGMLQATGGTSKELQKGVREGRISQEVADWASISAGAVEGAVERLLPGLDRMALGAVRKDVQDALLSQLMRRSLLKTTAAEAGQEGFEEVLAEVYNDALGRLLVDPDKPLLDSVKGITKSFAAGAALGGLAGGVAAGAARLGQPENPPKRAALAPIDDEPGALVPADRGPDLVEGRVAQPSLRGAPRGWRGAAAGGEESGLAQREPDFRLTHTDRAGNPVMVRELKGGGFEIRRPGGIRIVRDEVPTVFTPVDRGYGAAERREGAGGTPAERPIWQQTHREFTRGLTGDERAEANGLHVAEVSAAAERGEDVPPAVLDDYPHLHDVLTRARAERARRQAEPAPKPATPQVEGARYVLPSFVTRQYAGEKGAESTPDSAPPVAKPTPAEGATAERARRAVERIAAIEERMQAGMRGKSDVSPEEMGRLDEEQGQVRREARAAARELSDDEVWDLVDPKVKDILRLAAGRDVDPREVPVFPGQVSKSASRGVVENEWNRRLKARGITEETWERDEAARDAAHTQRLAEQGGMTADSAEKPADQPEPTSKFDVQPVRHRLIDLLTEKSQAPIRRHVGEEARSDEEIAADIDAIVGGMTYEQLQAVSPAGATGTGFVSASAESSGSQQLDLLLNAEAHGRRASSGVEPRDRRGPGVPEMGIPGKPSAEPETQRREPASEYDGDATETPGRLIEGRTPGTVRGMTEGVASDAVRDPEPRGDQGRAAGAPPAAPPADVPAAPAEQRAGGLPERAAPQRPGGDAGAAPERREPGPGLVGGDAGAPAGPARRVAPTAPPLGALPSPAAPSLPTATRAEISGERADISMGADAVLTGGAVARFEANVRALEATLDVLERGRATPEQREAIARFSGWGDSAFEHAFKPEEETRWLQPAEKARNEQIHALARRIERLGIEKSWLAKVRASRLNANFTTAAVIEPMWEALRRLGFGSLPRIRVLEPSAGVGRFLGLQPSDLAARSERTAVELEPLTGAMLRILFPQSRVFAGVGYQDAPIPPASVDLAISNVPFGNYHVADRSSAFWASGRSRFLRASIHNYFFAKALDQVRPGGVVAFITSRYSMDSREGQRVREYLASRADFLGAVRLPQGTFPDTDVITDVVFLQVRPEGQKPKGPAWTKAVFVKAPDRFGSARRWEANRQVDNGYWTNEYYVANPGRVLGDPKLGQTRYGGNEYTLPPPSAWGDLDVRRALDAALRFLPKGVVEEWRGETPRAATTAVPSGAFEMQDGKIHVREADGTLKRYEGTAEAQARVQGMLTVRDAAERVLSIQKDPETPRATFAQALTALNAAYDQFVAKYGPLNARKNVSLMRRDPRAFLLRALEQWTPENERAARIAADATLRERLKAAIFRERTVSPERRIERADSPKDAMLVSLNERGRLDWERMAQLTGQTPEQLRSALAGQGLIYLNPAGDWETADQYLSGNVRDKLKAARAAAEVDPRFGANVAALKPLIPRDLKPSQISVRPGSPWLPADVVNQFVAETFGAEAGWGDRHGPKSDQWFAYNEALGRWHQRGKPARLSAEANRTYGSDRLAPIEALMHALQQTSPTIYDTTADGERVFNKEATAAAEERVRRVKQAFARWIWQDAERAARLVRLYNDTFNGLRLRRYDGAHLSFPGQSATEALRPHQKDAIWRVLQDGTGGLYHEVGFGKTFAMAASAMELRRLGLSRKPMFVLLKSTVEQFAAEFQRLYPGARLLVPTAEDFQKENRRELMARIQTGDWDAVLLSTEQFTSIPVSPETEAAFVQEQIDQFSAALRMEEAERRESGERQAGRTEKDIAKAIQRFAARLNELQGQLAQRRDDAVVFEDLGVDMLFVDEAQQFKNLPIVTRQKNVRGLATASKVQRAPDLRMKARWLQQRQDGRGLVMATGTPLSNTLAEMWVSNMFLQPDEMEARGLQHFDAWANTFGEIVRQNEITVGGKLKEVSRFARFTNVPELSAFWQRVADIRMSADVPDMERRKPRIVGGEREGSPIMVLAPARPEFGGFMKWLEARIKDLSGKAEKGADNMLAIATDGRKGSLDLRLIPRYRSLPDDPDSKVNKAVDQIFTIWQEEKADRGTQIVFIDLGTPQAERKKLAAEDEGAVEEPVRGEDEIVMDDDLDAEETSLRGSVYEDIRRKLVAKGIPEAEIKFIHEARKPEQRLALFSAMNDGKVRVLLGSTQMLGTGVNVQRRLAALHHLDVPWTFASLEQRDGRGHRPGNLVYGPTLEETDDGVTVVDRGRGIRIYRYATQGAAGFASFDAFMWQAVEAKAKGIRAITKRGEIRDRTVSDIDSAINDLANMKAGAVGNPLIKRKTDAETEIARLELLRADHQDSRVRSLMQARAIEGQIAEAEGALEQVRADAAKRDATLPGPRAETVERLDAALKKALSGSFGKHLALIAEADAAKRQAMQANSIVAGIAASDRLETLLKTMPDPVDLGEYRGFPLLLVPQFSTVHGVALHVKVGGYETTSFKSADATGDGILRRIDNTLAGIDPEHVERRIERLRADLEGVERAADAPFEFEDRLRRRMEQVRRIESELSETMTPTEQLMLDVLRRDGPIGAGDLIGKVGGARQQANEAFGKLAEKGLVRQAGGTVAAVSDPELDRDDVPELGLPEPAQDEDEDLPDEAPEPEPGIPRIAEPAGEIPRNNAISGNLPEPSPQNPGIGGDTEPEPVIAAEPEPEQSVEQSPEQSAPKPKRERTKRTPQEAIKRAVEEAPPEATLGDIVNRAVEEMTTPEPDPEPEPPTTGGAPRPVSEPEPVVGRRARRQVDEGQLVLLEGEQPTMPEAEPPPPSIQGPPGPPEAAEPTETPSPEGVSPIPEPATRRKTTAPEGRESRPRGERPSAPQAPREAPPAPAPAAAATVEAPPAEAPSGDGIAVEPEDLDVPPPTSGQGAPPVVPPRRRPAPPSEPEDEPSASARDAPTSDEDVPTSEGEPPPGDERHHLVGAGYFSGLTTDEQKARLQELLDEWAQYSRSGGVAQSRIYRWARQMGSDPEQIHALVARSLGEDSRTRPVEGQALRTALVGAFYQREKLEREAKRLKRVAESKGKGAATAREKLPAALAALEAARRWEQLVGTASRRRTEAVARELNQHKFVFTAVEARKLSARLTEVAKQIDETAKRLRGARGKPNPTQDDLDLLKRLREILEEQGDQLGMDGDAQAIIDALRQIMRSQRRAPKPPTRKELDQAVREAETILKNARQVRTHRRYAGPRQPQDDPLMQAAIELVRLNRAMADLRSEVADGADIDREAFDDLEEQRQELVNTIEQILVDRELKALEKEKPGATREDAERAMAKSILGQVRRNVRQQIRFPNLDLDRLQERLDREMRKALDREKIDALIEQIKQLDESARTTWRTAGFKERLDDLLRETKELGDAVYARAQAVREAAMKARIAAYAGQMAEDQYQKFIDALADVDPSDPEQFRHFMRALRRPMWSDKVKEWTLLNMLSSLMTWGPTGVNMVSNTVHILGQFPNTFLDATHDMVRHGGKNISYGELARLGRGMAQGMPEGAARAGEMWWTGQLRDDVERRQLTADVRGARREILPDTPGLGLLFRLQHLISTRPLAAADAGMGHVLYLGVWQQLADREARRLLREGNGSHRVPAPTQQSPNATRAIRDHGELVEWILSHPWEFDHLMQEAGTLSDYSLLRAEWDPKHPKRFMAKAEQIMGALSAMRTAPPGASHGEQAVAVGTHFLFPFLTVGWNFLKMGVELSPVGMAYQATAYAGERDPVQQARRARLVAVGLLLLLLAMALKEADTLTGDGPEDPSERRRWLETHRPNSIRINGTWYSLEGWVVSMPLLMVANGIEMGDEALKKQGKRLDPAALPEWVAAFAGGLAVGAADAVLGQSFMRSAMEISEIMRGRTNAERFAVSAAGRGVPESSMLAFLARLGDQFERAPDGFGEGMAARLPDALKASGYPGRTRGDVPEALDLFGKPRENQQQGARALLPGRPWRGPREDDPLMKRVDELGINVPGAPRSINTVPLTREEQQRFLKTAGPQIEERLRGLLVGTSGTDPYYAKAAEQQIGAIRAQVGRDLLWAIPFEERERRRVLGEK